MVDTVRVKKNRLVKDFTIDDNDNKKNNDNRIVFLSNENTLQKTIPTYYIRL